SNDQVNTYRTERYDQAQKNSQLISYAATAMLIVEVAAITFALISLNIPGVIVMGLLVVPTYDAAIVFKNASKAYASNRQGQNETEITDNISKVLIDNFFKHSKTYDCYKQWLKPHVDQLIQE
ncbi:MAG: hypothetical protein P0S94_01740, partial [Simkaniaceae bacterium]|nr:hypothetical protein [Simkaniaceae bacterium]